MEVRHELSRIHKNQLRATLLGASTSHQGQGGHPSGTECPSSSSCPVATTSTSTSGPAVTALPIYHLEEISDPSKGYRVSHPDMELFKRQKLGYLFTDGEENLVDLQQGLENGRQVPVPDVVEISDERYDKLYPVIDCPIFISQTDHAFGSGSSTETTELGTESPPPYYLNESMLCSSFGEGCDTDYDLDEEDAEFLVEKRRFEGLISYFLAHNLSSKSDFDQLLITLDEALAAAEEPPPPPPPIPVPSSNASSSPRSPKPEKKKLGPDPKPPPLFPISVPSRSQLCSVMEYFLEKSEKIPSSLAWQPVHIPEKKSRASPVRKPRKKSTTSSASPGSPRPFAYKIFRPPIPKVEPKVLRSSKNLDWNFASVRRLKKKASVVCNFATYFKSVMQLQVARGLEQRKFIADKLAEFEMKIAAENGEGGDNVEKGGDNMGKGGVEIPTGDDVVGGEEHVEVHGGDGDPNEIQMNRRSSSAASEATTLSGSDYSDATTVEMTTEESCSDGECPTTVSGSECSDFMEITTPETDDATKTEEEALDDSVELVDPAGNKLSPATSISLFAKMTGNDVLFVGEVNNENNPPAVKKRGHKSFPSSISSRPKSEKNVASKVSSPRYPKRTRLSDQGQETLRCSPPPGPDHTYCAPISPSHMSMSEDCEDTNSMQDIPPPPPQEDGEMWDVLAQLDLGGEEGVQGEGKKLEPSFPIKWVKEIMSEILNEDGGGGEGGEEDSQVSESQEYFRHVYVVHPENSGQVGGQDSATNPVQNSHATSPQNFQDMNPPR
ncbi:hypothetical protein Fcan01_21734 [Folsomia candida]|uniref:Uncharacterized protein n=1 Tax=Folsomia candida TaxID=158441 RepID=A0A226DDZ5_FOLCA|nr:hypothetical protein Fcan01_21734 [Folsomia candida]